MKPTIQITADHARYYQRGWGTVVFSKGEIVTASMHDGEYAKREMSPTDLETLVLMGKAKRISHGEEYAAS